MAYFRVALATLCGHGILNVVLEIQKYGHSTNLYWHIFMVPAGSFPLLEMLFDDCILYLIESHAIVSEDSADTTSEFSVLRSRSLGR